MATASERERVSHVVRRLSMGTHPDLVTRLETLDAARAAALDLSAAPPTPFSLPVPRTRDEARDVSALGPAIAWWVDRMRSPQRLVEERLVWFWHDHFATGIQKVRSPYLMVRQQQTIRQHATGNFADLLHAIAKDPAMLVYLDGVSNRAGNVNENFGRECLELFTLGRDAGYTQADVVAMAHACTGWIVNVPGRPRIARVARGAAPYDAVFVAALHDAGVTTLLGRRGTFDLDAALDVVLSRPETARHVASKLYRELVGVDPDEATAHRLGAAFGRDYAVMPLVEAIVADPAFVADQAIRAKVRTPVERLVAALQAGGADTPLRVGAAGRARRTDGASGVGLALRTLGYVPFAPPNVGGYPKGDRLLGPHQLVHGLDLLAALDGPPAAARPPDTTALFARFGAFDVSARARAAVDAEDDPGRRFALAFSMPEVVLG